MTVPAEPYLPSPAACARLEQIVQRWDGSLTLRTGETHVEYALPSHASAEIRTYLQSYASVNFERAYVARLPGGRVFGSGNVLSPDGEMIARDVSPDFGKPFDDHWLLNYRRIRPPVSLPGTTAVIATTLGVGYSHWLLEELPRLIPLKPDECETLIAHTGHAYQREAVALHGFTGKVLPAKRYAHHRCEQLIVPSPGHPTLTTLHTIGRFTAPLLLSAATSGERLYISRAKARRRRVANESKLWAKLSAHGFVRLFLEDLTWQEQINAFRGAKVIVAPHGAGLANLAFCPPGTRVIELFHRSYVNGYYWQLAALKALDYRPVAIEGDAPLAQDLSANRNDIEANVDQVLQALST